MHAGAERDARTHLDSGVRARPPELDVVTAEAQGKGSTAQCEKACKIAPAHRHIRSVMCSWRESKFFASFFFPSQTWIWRAILACPDGALEPLFFFRQSQGATQRESERGTAAAPAFKPEATHRWVSCLCSSHRVPPPDPFGHSAVALPLTLVASLLLVTRIASPVPPHQHILLASSRTDLIRRRQASAAARVPVHPPLIIGLSPSLIVVVCTDLFSPFPHTTQPFGQAPYPIVI